MKTFVYRRLLLYQVIGCVVLFGGFGVVSAWFFATTEPSDDFPQTTLRFVGSISHLLFATMTALSLWGLAECLKTRLKIGGERVEFRGVVSSIGFSLADVAEARWREWPAGGSLKLRDVKRRKLLTLDFLNYERNDRLELIRWFRSRLPLGAQHGWAWFCFRCNPRKEDPHRDLGVNEVRLTRRRWDIILAIGFLPILAAAVVTWRMTGGASVLGAPIIFMGLLLVARFGVPRSGLTCQRIRWHRPTRSEAEEIASACDREWGIGSSAVEK